MTNNYETQNNLIEKPLLFSFPVIEEELGEIERTAKTFNSEDYKEFMKKFIEKTKQSSLTYLTEDIWKVLENTDSYDIPPGDFGAVKHNAEEVGREWESKKEALENGVLLPASIILKFGTRYHKVAGNTRLMIARAMGSTPQVLIVDMTD